MSCGVNKDHSQDTIVRVSPKRNAIIVEEHKENGVVTYKEISPIDFYWVLNQSYVSQDFLCSGFLPENCLHVAMNSMETHYVLWNPELRANLTYEGREYPDFPLPRLVIGVRMLESGRIAECSIGVVADERPTLESEMYYYPFSNVHDDSKVCTGNNVLPSYKNTQSLRYFPRYLLELPDNDDMYDTEKNRLNLSHRELMEHLKDKEPSYYYTDVLVPNGKTLSDFLMGG